VGVIKRSLQIWWAFFSQKPRRYEDEEEEDRSRADEDEDDEEDDAEEDRSRAVCLADGQEEDQKKKIRRRRSDEEDQKEEEKKKVGEGREAPGNRQTLDRSHGHNCACGCEGAPHLLHLRRGCPWPPKHRRQGQLSFLPSFLSIRSVSIRSVSIPFSGSLFRARAVFFFCGLLAFAFSHTIAMPIVTDNLRV
jgi:hypothetical protein